MTPSTSSKASESGKGEQNAQDAVHKNSLGSSRIVGCCDFSGLLCWDDGRQTIEIDDRYIIKPQFTFWNDEVYNEMGATPVAEDFEYTSDNNSEWLSDDAFQELLSKI